MWNEKPMLSFFNNKRVLSHPSDLIILPDASASFRRLTIIVPSFQALSGKRFAVPLLGDCTHFVVFKNLSNALLKNVEPFVQLLFTDS